MSDAVGRLRQLGDNATEGPWAWGGTWVTANESGSFADVAESGADAEFIAAARNVWDALLDVAEWSAAVRQWHVENRTRGNTSSEDVRDLGRRVRELEAALDRLDKETPS